MNKLVLRSAARNARALRAHPWVFSNEVESVPGPEADGQAWPLEDARGRHLGMGLVNTRSRILWRRYSFGRQPWNSSFWEPALRAALASREEEPFRRLVWSEADDLPGLVVDQFDDCLVVQALTRGVDRVLPRLLDLLQDMLEPREILLRNDAPSRQLEGLDLQVATRSGKPLEPFWAKIYKAWFHLDLQNAQKTGFYLDQRQEHFKVATFAEGWRVLDAFCNQGAFGINCALAGAREVIGLDSSAEAIRQARENASRNQVEVAFQETNVFDYFTANRAERFDLVILDPPSFAPTRKALPGALKGYKELQLRAFKCLQPGGILATYCCSHHVSESEFLEVLSDAAADARRRVQLLYTTGQPLDHPVRLNFPESSYLKGWILRMQD